MPLFQKSSLPWKILVWTPADPLLSFLNSKLFTLLYVKNFWRYNLWDNLRNLFIFSQIFNASSLLIDFFHSIVLRRLYSVMFQALNCIVLCSTCFLSGNCCSALRDDYIYIFLEKVLYSHAELSKSDQRT